MPYFKRRRYRRYPRYRRRYRRRGNTAKLWSVVKQLKRDTKPELKYHDRNVTNEEILSGTPVVQCINLIGQGVTEKLRIGDKIQIKSVQVKGQVRLSVAANEGVNNYTRVVIVRDKDPLGSNPAWTDIFVSEDINSLRLIKNAGQYNVWFDRLIKTVYDADGVPILRVNFKHFRKTNFQVEYNLDNTQPQKNGIYLMAISTVSQATWGDIDYNSRVRFTDV